MMAHEKKRAGRRYPSVKWRGERESSLAVLTAQMVFCGLLVLFCYGAVRTEQPFVKELAARYQELLTTRTQDFSLETVLADLPDRYAKARDEAVDAAARILTEWIAPAEPAAPETEPEQLDGMGGWMGTGKAEKAPPSSCRLSPILTSARVEPPASGKVTSVYGYRIHPLTEGDDFHRGLDIAAAQGSGIYAALPGQVIAVDASAIYGNYVTLDHGNGFTTTYCHCDTVVARLGAHLRQGELIATVGSTGLSTGPHVHFEVSEGGIYYDPAWVLEGMKFHGV